MILNKPKSIAQRLVNRPKAPLKNIAQKIASQRKLSTASNIAKRVLNKSASANTPISVRKAAFITRFKPKAVPTQDVVTPNESMNYLPEPQASAAPSGGGGEAEVMAPTATPEIKTAGTNNVVGILIVVAILGGMVWFGGSEKPKKEEKK